MALTIALVKNGASNGGGAPAFGQSTTAGNLLVCTVSALLGTGSGNFTCSDGTWTRAVQDVSRANVQTAIFYKQNCGAGETAPTFSYSGSPSTTTCVLWEFSGAARGTPLDKTGHANAAGSAGAGAMPNVACGSANSTTGELVITADAISFGSGGTITSSDSYNQGATPTGNINADSTSTRQHYRQAYGITTGNSSASTNAPTDSNTGSGDIISGCIATFKPALSISATAGSVAITGAAATFKQGRYMSATPPAMAISGADATLPRALKSSATPGSVAITGADATLSRGWKLSGTAGAIAITGDTASSSTGLHFQGDPGAIDITGDDLSVSRARYFIAGVGDVALVGADAVLSYGIRTDVLAGSIIITGAAATGSGLILVGEAPRTGLLTRPDRGLLTEPATGRITKART